MAQVEACEFCTGSGWISDTEALGPCVCVTPATVSALREELRDYQLGEDDVGDAHEALRRYFVRIGLGHNPIIIDDPDLRECWGKLTP